MNAPTLRMVTDDINFTEVIVYPIGQKSVRLVLHGEPFGTYGTESSMVATLRDDQADLLLTAIQEIRNETRNGRKIKARKAKSTKTTNAKAKKRQG